MSLHLSPVARIFNLVREEKAEISAIYFYAICNGLIQLSLPVGIQAIIGFIMAGTLSASLVLLISLIVAGVLLVGLLQMAQMKMIEKIQQKIFVRNAFAFAHRIPRLDLKAVDNYYLPELVNRFFDTVSLQKGISKLLLDLPVAVIQILFGLILLSFYHPAFILFGVLLIAVLGGILYATGSRGLESSLAESSYKYGVAGWLEELGRMVKSFKFATGSNLPLQRADERTVHYLDARTRHFRVLLTQYRTLVVFKVFITAAMLIVGVVLLLGQQINVGQFVAAEIIIVSVIASVEKIIVNLENVYDVLTSVEKIGKLTDKPLEQSGRYRLEADGIAIRAQELGFSFGSRPLLRQLSFSIGAGQKVCVTGPDGSGKSTLLRLLTGAYRDFDGALLINEVPVGNFDLDSLRSRTGIFFLGEHIFNGTLMENLTLGRSTDAAWLRELVAATGLLQFLATLPQGFDTELDATGKRLPQNVVHKILFVRALAQKPLLLLMEDPWRHIEEPYRGGLRNLLLSLPGTTVLIATNDPECLARANQVVRL
ncbi:MAG: ATP-binding cassette domain-containing protein [Chitinophagaceae bacterium]|nr:MAG: ATP-binding cassette domain-containing protein [Chitinophagaceae bacterium]